jgi:hypothetical protein
MVLAVGLSFSLALFLVGTIGRPAVALARPRRKKE